MSHKCWRQFGLSALEIDLSPDTVTPVAIVAAGLEQLSEPELVCLELAWDALLAGTIPVGAVVVDADGRIIASGRNAVYGQPDPRLLCGSRLAHAEINALMWLQVGQRFSDCRLVTSLEPCQLCVGALRMATIGALTFVGADPVNGTAWVLESARYVGHRPVSVTGPAPGPAGRLAAGLALAHTLSRAPTSTFTVAARDRSPELTGAADALIESGVFAMAASRMTWPQAAPKLLAVV
jgi:tRNA(adenine34) deaminase